MNAVIDNDILLKGACYGLLDEFLSPIHVGKDSVGVLGAAQYVVPQRIRKRALSKGIAAAIQSLNDFLGRATMLEPSEVEQNMAAHLELIAQRAGAGLDAGESQLCAIVILRSVPLLLTGDKRAIRAMEELLEYEARLSSLCGRVKCFEQLVLDFVSSTGDAAALRTAICADIHVDKTLAICFGCHSRELGDYDARSGLSSYISDLRRQAARVLIS